MGLDESALIRGLYALDPRLSEASRGPYTLRLGTVDATRYRVHDATDLVSLRFSVGRKGAGETFAPAVIQFAVEVADPADVLAYRVGDTAIVSLTSTVNAGLGPITWFERHRGFLTDLDLSYRRTPDGAVRAVLSGTATGPLARIGQVRVGQAPGQLLAATRIGDAIRNAGAEVLPPGPAAQWFGLNNTGNGAQVYLRADIDPDRAPALALAQDWADDVGAYLYEDTEAARITLEDLDARRGRTPIAVLTPDLVGIDVTWTNTINSLLNRYTLTYGTNDDRREITVEDADSIAAYGEFAAGRDSDLLLEADASLTATLIVGRNSRPHWTISSIRVNVLRVLAEHDKALARALITAKIGSLIEFANLPDTAPDARYFFVEGIEVDLTKHDWWLTVHLSEAGQTGAPPRWSDVDPTLTWDDPSLVDSWGDPLTWLTSGAWFPPPG